MKRPCPMALAILTGAGFVFLFVTDFLIHGNLLMGLYENTSQLWRPEEDMGTYFPWMLGVQILIALIVALIYVQNHEGTGIGEGVRFGLMIGAFMAVMMGGSYAWMPIPIELAIGWGIAGLAQGLGLGVIYSLLYGMNPKHKAA